MKRKNSISVIIATFIFLLNNFLVTVCCAQSSGKPFESYYLRSTNYPSFGNLWTLNGLGDGEVQGVTNDNANWFFTWSYNNVGYMFKVPVRVPINNDVLKNPNVSMINMTKFRDLAGYWHWGDPDHYKDSSGTDYVVVPMTEKKKPPIIAIFRARDLSLVAYGQLKQQSTGWCAVHPLTGDLYTSEDFDYASGELRCNRKTDCDDQSYHCLYPRVLLHYSIPWKRLPSSGYIGEIPLTYIASPVTELLTGEGRSIELYNMQGGEFSPSGELLYISSGSGCCFGHGAGQEYYFDGLHVFNTQTWRTVKRSYNHDGRFPLTKLPKYFDYYYPLGCDGAGSWSPQGLTIWDLDDGRAPDIRGQLHILLFKFRATGENRQVFEHFGNRLYVDLAKGIDRSIPGTPSEDHALPGAPQSPFKTFKYAYNSYPPWDGSEIVLKAGQYSAVGKYSTPVRIVSQGGSAILK